MIGVAGAEVINLLVGRSGNIRSWLSRPSWTSRKVRASEVFMKPFGAYTEKAEPAGTFALPLNVSIASSFCIP
ncbi:hypothetical protein D3C76_718300 [compost metagenome]